MSELSASDSNREETPDSAASDDMRDGEPRRTDPRTFLVQAVEIIPRMVVPLVAVAFATRDEGSFALPVMLGFVGLRKMRIQLGWIRFIIMSVHLVVMALLPLKMVLRWLFTLKYFIYLPEINLNV